MHSMFFRIALPAIDIYENLMFDVDIRRHMPLPPGPKILASNHPSTTDPFLILEITPEPVHILIEERLFQVPVFGSYLHLSGHIPVVPGRGREAYRAAVRILREKKSVALYPEGAISPPEGGFYKPRTGAARMALEADVPVVPIGVALDRSRIRRIETDVKGEPVVGTWYLGGPYAITVGSPLVFRGDVEDRDRVDAVAGEIMRSIVRLETESMSRLKAGLAERRLRPGIRSLLGELLYD
jgi:1-acyl-sn-glycerol-3-phosphate acyltransferase